MATNKPDSRETHITRIFGTNKNGDRLDDVWVDVERIDVEKGAMQVPPDMQWQGYQRRFRWCDDPNSDDYDPDGTPSRKMEIIKVCDPEQGDVDDPEEWVPVKVIRGLRPRVETGMASNGGTAMERFLSSLGSEDQDATARIVEVRKIVHCDTNVDDEIQAAASADAGLLEYVIPSEQYVKNQSTKDDGQYVEHEIITYLKHKGNAAELSGIGRQTKLLNEYLIDDSDAPDGKVVGAYGLNPPYRLDPYQNIINVNWSRTVLVCFQPVGNSNTMRIELTSDKAKVMFEGNLSPSGVSPVHGVIVKLPANVGTFAKVTMQGSIGDTSAGGGWPGQMLTWTCPFDASDPEGSVLAVRKIAGGSGIDVPGVLFCTLTPVLPPGSTLIWKSALAPHKKPSRGKMVQCYPISVTPNSITVQRGGTGDANIDDFEILGFSVITYRTDRKATGRQYKTPPEWKTDVVIKNYINGVQTPPGDSEYGIAFKDKLPLISSDIPL